MSINLVEKSCADFAAVLASKEPVPGGGGAAALTGALGVALCSMVGNFTSGKKKYAAYEVEMQAMLIQCEQLRQHFVQLVDQDAQAFAPLAQAYAIPKEDPTRDHVLENATGVACMAPIKMMECCCEAIDLLENMRQKGSTMLISDVGCGALLCKAALESAALNVFVNTKTLKDRAAAEHLEAQVDHILQVYSMKAAEIAEYVTRSIRK